MPEDRTPIDHGLAHPQPERGTIPQPKPKADEDKSELVPNQRTVDPKVEEEVAGKDDDAPAWQPE